MLNQDPTKLDSMLNVLKAMSTNIKHITTTEAIHILPSLKSFMLSEKMENICRSSLLNGQEKYLLEKINDPIIRYFIARYYYRQGNYGDLTLGYCQSIIEDQEANIEQHGQAAYMMSIVHADHNNNVEFIKYSRMAIDLGNAQAMIELGAYYYYQKIGYDYDFAHKMFLHASQLNARSGFLFLGASYNSGKGIQQNYIQAFICFTEALNYGVGATKTHIYRRILDTNLNLYINIELLKAMLEPTFINALSPLSSLHLGLSCIKWMQLYHENKIDSEQFKFSLELFQRLYFNQKNIQSTLIHDHVFNAEWLPMLPLLDEKYDGLTEKKEKEQYLANKFLTELKSENQKFLLNDYKDDLFPKNSSIFGLFFSSYSIQKTDIQKFFKHTLDAFDQKNRYTTVINKDSNIQFNFN